MRDLRLLLEDGAHEVGEVAVERDDLLELVEDEHGAAFALGGDPAREREQSLDRVVDGRRCRPAWKTKRRLPSLGSTSIVGVTRRPRKRRVARSSAWPAADSRSL